MYYWVFAFSLSQYVIFCIDLWCPNLQWWNYYSGAMKMVINGCMYVWLTASVVPWCLTICLHLWCHNQKNLVSWNMKMRCQKEWQIKVLEWNEKQMPWIMMMHVVLHVYNYDNNEHCHSNKTVWWCPQVIWSQSYDNRKRDTRQCKESQSNSDRVVMGMPSVRMSLPLVSITLQHYRSPAAMVM